MFPDVSASNGTYVGLSVNDASRLKGVLGKFFINTSAGTAVDSEA